MNCDAGTSTDAGSQDAGGGDAGEPDAGGPDAGEPDAGEPDAGEPDAGPAPDAGLEQLEVRWAQSDLVDPMYYDPRNGTLTPGGGGLVVHFREFEQLFDGPEVLPDSGVGFPVGSVLGDIVLLDLQNGDYVLEDGGRSSAPTDQAMRQFVLGERGPLSVLFPFTLVPFTERLSNGTMPQAPDGGPIAFGAGLFALFTPLAPIELFPTEPLKAVTSLGLPDGGSTLSWITFGPDAGMRSVSATDDTTTAGVDCGARAVDVVTTLENRQNGDPDHRLLQLSECTMNEWEVISWSRDDGPLRLPLSDQQQVRDARMAIASSLAPRRHPFVVWKGTDQFFRLARLSLDGSAIPNSRIVAGPNPLARIGAITVDDLDRPIVVFEAASLTLPGLQNNVQGAGAQVVVAGFDDNMRLRWAAPLAGTNRLRVNAVTFAEGALVLDVKCPNNPMVGDFCAPNRSSFAVRVALRDGGLP